jgi:hypothetical protein
VSGDPADLANLHDLAMPPPIPWWPSPLGWWIVAFAVLAVAAILVARAAARYHAAAYRRLAQRELAAIAAHAGAAEISELLKRTALAAYPRAVVAPLTGAAWLDCLDRTGGTSDFRLGPGSALPAAAFDASQPLSAAQRGPLVGCARRWIQAHRRC